MDLKVYLKFLWRWWWLFALFAVAGAGIAYFFTSQQVPMYAATAKVLVNQDQGLFSRPSPSTEDLRARERLALTVVELLQARPVIEQAAAGFEGVSANQLDSRVSADTLNNTELVVLTVRDPNPQRAADLANAIIASYQAQERTLLSNPFAPESSLVVIEPARASNRPVSPDVERNVLLSIVVAMLIAGGSGFIYDTYDTRMRNQGDMQRLTGLTPLAIIGVLRGSRPADKLVTLHDQRSPTAETYRMLRAHIDSFPLDRPVRTIVVTSGSPRDGRSISAANLAIAMAQTGRKVILVDGDLRQPSLHTLFDLENAVGLSNLLKSEGKLNITLRPVKDVPSLRLLTSGPQAANPAGLLGSARFLEVVEALSAEADLVIFDSPALLNVVDATLMIQAADATLLVARAGATSADTLRRAYAHLEQTGGSILGILLNGARGTHHRGLNYYYNRQQRPSLQPGAGPAEGRPATDVIARESLIAPKTSES